MMPSAMACWMTLSKHRAVAGAAEAHVQDVRAVVHRRLDAQRHVPAGRGCVRAINIHGKIRTELFPPPACETACKMVSSAMRGGVRQDLLACIRRIRASPATEIDFKMNWSSWLPSDCSRRVNQANDGIAGVARSVSDPASAKAGRRQRRIGNGCGVGGGSK